MRNRRDVELRELAAEYKAKSAVADPNEKRRLCAEQRKAEAVIVKARQPQDFGAWLSRKAERDEVVLERLEALYQQRGAAIEPELQPQKAPTRTCDPAEDARIAAAHRAKVERERAIGIELPAPQPKKKSK